ncbi:MAG: epimerase [Gammaproteobacteria bacterium RIFCSPHIGHO2_12_FULL_36_30]|nr:MAG: epimerase [Gammaproteobacteria bacterium RIFCSPHIGHO2_12_FULL_36_30]
MTSKIMITGAAGFIGSHLVERTLELGNEIYACDIIPIKKCNNLKNVSSHKKFHYLQGDITDDQFLREYYQSNADVIYHLASVVGVQNYMSDPLHLIDVTVNGTKKLLHLASQHKTRFIFSSTSEIYGKNPEVPWMETSDRVLGSTSVDRWSYSTSKAVCEHMLYGLYRKNKFPFSIVRFFNVYGPRQSPIYVASKSIYQILNGKSPYLYDNGKQTRCFTYISDIIDGLISVWQSDKAVGEAFNLGNQNENSINELINIIIECSGKQITSTEFNTKKEYGEMYEDIPRRVPNAEKAETLLNWKAKIKLKEGVEKTIRWARENRWWLA